MASPEHYEFTIEADGIANELRCRVGIAQASERTVPVRDVPWEWFDGIWDTGATHKGITENVVRKCGLPSSMQVVQVNTAGGTVRQPAHQVSLLLPNRVGFPDLRVTENKCSVDVLIGMDVINAGDFAITNKDGKTVFSFRIPSIERIDFTQRRSGIQKPVPFKKTKRRKRGKRR